MARPKYLKYVNLDEYYANLSVPERVSIAQKTKSSRVLDLLANDRAKSVRNVVALNTTFSLELRVAETDLAADGIPYAVLDWFADSGTTKQKKALSKNRTIPASYRRRFTPPAKRTKVLGKVGPSAQEVFKIVKTVEILEPTHAHLSMKEQLEYYNSGDIEKLVFLASAPETHPKIIRNLAGTENNLVRVAVAGRWDVPDDVLLELARIGDYEVRVALANRFHLSSIVAVQLYDYSRVKSAESPYRESGIYEALARNVCTPEGILVALAHKALPPLVWRFGAVKEKRKHILSAALQNPSYPGYMLAKYLRSGDHGLIRIIMGNPVLSTDDRNELAAELDTVSTDVKDLGL